MGGVDIEIFKFRMSTKLWSDNICLQIYAGEDKINIRSRCWLDVNWSVLLKRRVKWSFVKCAENIAFVNNEIASYITRICDV